MNKEKEEIIICIRFHANKTPSKSDPFDLTKDFSFPLQTVSLSFYKTNMQENTHEIQNVCQFLMGVYIQQKLSKITTYL